jgi:hypothetical protein
MGNDFTFMFQVCRLNGEFGFHVSDLTAPRGKPPLFAQLYVIDPQVATQRRSDSEIGKRLKRHILENLDNMIRKNNPLANAYTMAHNFYKDQQEKGKDSSFEN